MWWRCRSGWWGCGRGAHGIGVSGADLQRPGSHDLGVILTPDRALEQRYALARPDDLYIDAKLAKRDGPKKLVRDSSERKPLGGFQAFELDFRNPVKIAAAPIPKHRESHREG